MLSKSVTDAKFEPNKVTFLRLMPSTALTFKLDSDSHSTYPGHGHCKVIEV